jgi:hypothetical protein
MAKGFLSIKESLSQARSLILIRIRVAEDKPFSPRRVKVDRFNRLLDKVAFMTQRNDDGPIIGIKINNVRHYRKTIGGDERFRQPKAFTC